MCEVLDLVSGGIAALNHRLKAGIPLACGSNTRNQKCQVFFLHTTIPSTSGSERYVGESEDLRSMGLLFLKNDEK